MYLRVDVGAASLASDVADPQKHAKPPNVLPHHMSPLYERPFGHRPYVVGLKIAGRTRPPFGCGVAESLKQAIPSLCKIWLLFLTLCARM